MSTKRLQSGWRWLGAGVALVWLLPASGQVLKPVDPNKAADVDRKFVDPSMIGLKTLLQPTNPQSGRTAPQRTLGFSRVDLKWMDTETLRNPAITTDTHEHSRANFSAKRATATDTVRSEKTVESPKAPITDRTIHAYTPAGTEELKRQLRMRF